MCDEYPGKSVSFEYSHVIRYSDDTTNDKPATFYFLDVWSKDLEDIRTSLNLPTWLIFHITIGRKFKTR